MFVEQIQSVLLLEMGRISNYDIAEAEAEDLGRLSALHSPVKDVISS